MENLLSKLFVALSAIVIVVAIYTAYEYVTGNSGSCNVNAQINCFDVMHSGHTSLFGIPFYVFGLVWFPLLFILGFYLTNGTGLRIRADVLLPLLMVGNIFTLYLWYLELVVIHAICPLCLSLYIVNYVLTGLALYEAIS
jgi:uncharacterized membrane protein